MKISKQGPKQEQRRLTQMSVRELVEMSKVEQKLSLRVYQNEVRDVGRGIARIDYQTMDALNLKQCDVVEIRSSTGRRTVASVWALHPADEGRGKIQIDWITMANLGLGVPKRGYKNRDVVSVRKIKAVVAEKVMVAPLEKIPREAMPPHFSSFLACTLENVPLIRGDNVMIRWHAIKGDEVYSNRLSKGDKVYSGILSFQVRYVVPDDVVMVTQKTAFQIDTDYITKEEWDKRKKSWNPEDER
jgi:transitional endoplasmic reticulum ATPase